MLDSIIHEGTADQNHNETPLHTHQDGYNQKRRASKCWQQRVLEKLDLSHTVVGVKNGAMVLKISLAVPKKVQRSYPRTQQFHSEVYIPNTQVKPHIHTKTHTDLFPAASCIMAKCANNSTVQQIMSG